MLLPHLGPSTPTFRCTWCARRHRSSSSTSVRERLASASALAISGKRCEPGFPDAEPFYTYTAPPRIFFGLTILMSGNLHAVPRQPRRRCSSRARSHHVTWDSLPFGKDSHSHRVSALAAHHTVTDRATSGFRRGQIALSQADARDARSRNGECKTMDATTRRSEPHKY
jgi:hypothetical protein